MKRTAATLQVAFTYIGTVVGAGFASGQEILQFFTKYGDLAMVTIWISTFLFVWFGTKMMLLSNQIGAKTYGDVNVHLLGPRIGTWFTGFLMIELLGVSIVMLAGAGSVFMEYWRLPFLLGSLVTVFCAFLVVQRGMRGIMSLNVIIVPFMLLFTCIVGLHSWLTFPLNAGEWMQQYNVQDSVRAWFAPILYTAFNLASAQAVLVPLASSITDRTVIRRGGIIGGLGLGLLLIAGHISLSTKLPEIVQYEIPMGIVVTSMGVVMQQLFIVAVFAEIFTTFVANVFGLSVQCARWMQFRTQTITVAVLAICFLISFVGFKTLLSTLYPLFGILSLVWFGMLMIHKPQRGSQS
jgi:uncharacterized membrane protein YkvI